MRWFTVGVTAALVCLLVGMSLTGTFSGSDLANNLTAELIGSLLTVVVVKVLTDQDARRRASGLLSDMYFLTLVDIRINIQTAVDFLIADMPSGVEASERWGDQARLFRDKRQMLGTLIPDEWLARIVALEQALKRMDLVTARGEDSRLEYARDVESLWHQYHSLMSFILSKRDRSDPGFGDLLTAPRDFEILRRRYTL